jgi:type IV pilus assembly protein PilC
MQNYGILIVGLIVGLIVAFYFSLRIMPIKRAYDKAVLKIPVFGSLNQEYQLTIISQLSSILFKSGLPVRQTLAIVSESVTNTQYSYSLMGIMSKIEKGTKLSTAIEKYPHLYPEIFISVVATGESAGGFSESLSYLATFFGERVTERTKKLPTVIEPLLLIVIGLLVAFIASAIILPVYQITTAL